jgi:PAS domain S-box-containing protein
MSIPDQDLSKNKHYDDLQKANIDFSKLLLEFKDYSLVMLDSAGHVISWNAGAEHLFGYRAEEITGKHISIIYSPEDQQNGQTVTDLNLAVAKGRYEFEALKYRKNRSAFYANTILTVLYNTDNSIKRFLKVSRDISKQKLLEE